MTRGRGSKWTLGEYTIGNYARNAEYSPGTEMVVIGSDSTQALCTLLFHCHVTTALWHTFVAQVYSLLLLGAALQPCP